VIYLLSLKAHWACEFYYWGNPGGKGYLELSGFKLTILWFPAWCYDLAMAAFILKEPKYILSMFEWPSAEDNCALWFVKAAAATAVGKLIYSRTCTVNTFQLCFILSEISWKYWKLIKFSSDKFDPYLKKLHMVNGWVPKPIPNCWTNPIKFK